MAGGFPIHGLQKVPTTTPQNDVRADTIRRAVAGLHPGTLGVVVQAMAQDQTAARTDSRVLTRELSQLEPGQSRQLTWRANTRLIVDSVSWGAVFEDARDNGAALTMTLRLNDNDAPHFGEHSQGAGLSALGTERGVPLRITPIDARCGQDVVANIRLHPKAHGPVRILQITLHGVAIR